MKILDKGTIYGKVTDYITDLTLQNVTISTVPATYTATTDQSGNYILFHIDAGSYIVTASKEGYNNTNKSIHVQDGDSVLVNLSLGGGLNADPQSHLLSVFGWFAYSIISGGNGSYSVEYLGPNHHTVDTHFNGSYLFITPTGKELGLNILLVKDGSSPAKAVKISVTVY